MLPPFWFPSSLYELWYWKYRKNFLVKTWHCSYATWHFVFLFTWTAHRNTNRFFWTYCGHVHLNNPQRNQHYFTWLFVFILFTWTAHRKTNIISLIFCGRVHLNSQQRNWHILLDILWSCYLNHLQINQRISPDILCLYSLALPPPPKENYFT